MTVFVILQRVYFCVIMLTVAICYSMGHFFAFSPIFCPVFHSELFLYCGLKLHGWSLCQFNSVSADKIKVMSGISVCVQTTICHPNTDCTQ